MDLKLNNLSEFTLTNGYIPVEYVQTSGYPNINTGVTYSYATRNLKIDLVIDVISNSADNSVIFDATNSSKQTYLKCTTADDNTSFVTRYYQQNTQTETSIEFSGKTHIIESVNYLKVDDTEYTLSNTSAAITATLYLFKSGSTVTNVYAFKVYQSTTLIRDYIPAVSYQEGHFGEACLYDKVNNTFYYSASTGSFTASTNIYDRIANAFVKDCPNISGIDLLRRATNLERIRCNISNAFGPLSEVQHYATLNGYSDDYEEQVKPRIVGSFVLTDYYSNAELDEVNNSIDGITVTGDNTKNIEYLLANDMLAVQTLDSSAPNYNPAAAIILQAGGYGTTISEPLITGEGRYALDKAQAAAMTSIPISLFRSKSTVVDQNAIVTSNDEEEYDFSSFDDFAQFTGLTTITAGSSTSETGAFGGCTALESIKIPNGVTTIGAYAFYGCTALSRIVLPQTLLSVQGSAFYGCSGITGDVVIPETASSIGQYAFYGCTNITNLTARVSNVIYNNTLHHSGNGTGTLRINSIRSYNNSSIVYRYKTILIYGNTSHPSSNIPIFQGTDTNIASAIEVIRVKGLCDPGGNYTGNQILQVNKSNSYYKFKFFEVMGTYSTTNTAPCLVGSNSTLATTFIAHAGYNGIAGIPTTFKISFSSFNMLYVGDGSSRANDEAVLALYLADTNWSTYSAKLATWYDYNGEYKWYYITDNLTNCTNTNPDEWPHITRGEEYRTTIVADEGYTLDTVKVEMYSARDNSLTPDEPTDITSAVYNASTGEIYIQEVVGNVIITASAS